MLCAHIDAAEDAARGLTGGVGSAVQAAYVFDATSPVRAETKFRTKHDRSKQGYFASHFLDTMGLVRDRTDVALQLWQTSHVGSPTNEWVGVEAARFASDGERLPVRVLRCPSSYFSMRPNRPCRAWQRSARELAGRQVAARLRARSTHTVVADDCHIALGSLDAKAETVLAQVRADRCFVADGRRYNSVEVERVGDCGSTLPAWVRVQTNVVALCVPM